MDSLHHITDSGVEFDMLDNGGIIIQDANKKNIVGLSQDSLNDLYTFHSDSGWNTSYNNKHFIRITVLDTVYVSYLKKIGLIDKIKKALDYFPELTCRTVYVGILMREREAAFACVDTDNQILKFNVDLLENAENVEGWNVCIFHELMHIVQRIRDLPKTEEYCSIHAMARMPNHLVDCDYISYISDNGNREYNADLCRKAVGYRESGGRGYIKYVKSLIRDANNDDHAQASHG